MRGFIIPLSLCETLSLQKRARETGLDFRSFTEIAAGNRAYRETRPLKSVDRENVNLMSFK